MAGNKSEALNSTLLPESIGGRPMIRFPSAVPLILLPFMLRSPEITAADLETLKTRVFNGLLNGTIVDYATFLTTFRGKALADIPDTIATINDRIQSEGSLSERVRLLVLPEYRVVSPENSVTDKYSGNVFEPVFTVISKEAGPRGVQPPELGFALFTAIAGFVATFVYATGNYYILSLLIF
jgi:hypothetical protein